jgi:hypothetical protein
MVLAVVWSMAGRASSQTAEDYKVYDAVIREMFRDGITRFDMNAKVNKIVIRDRTRSEYAYGPKNENWQQVKLRLRSLTDETIQGYESARKNEHELKAKLEVPFRYFLISDKRLEELVPHPNGPMERWNEFYKLYPESGGYNSFSSVGYDRAGRNALIYFVNWCGSACGTGTYVLVEKGTNGWVVKEWAGIWIS